MNILMLTNTYLPHLGGVARSVSAFTEQLRVSGHQVLIVAPTFENQPEEELDVIRIPAIQHFNGTDFSVRLPIPVELSDKIELFNPDIVHSHHSFLMGDTALRVAALYNVPIIFTHHTMYEQYTHYVPGDSLALKRYVIDLTTSYANLCNRVIAPSESVREILIKRKVTQPIEVIPTGVDVATFMQGDGCSFRRKVKIPEHSFVVGHVGRLAEEKNLGFLCKAVGFFLKEQPDAHFLVVGSGDYEQKIQDFFAANGLSERLHLAGSRDGKELVDSYHAMDVFVFASQSETQGMVITEAMAAGLPVIAVDAPGVREIARSGENSYLLFSEDEEEFSRVLSQFHSLSMGAKEMLSAAALATAHQFSIHRTTETLIQLYSSLTDAQANRNPREHSRWQSAIRLIEKELEVWLNRAHAVGAAFNSSYDRML